MSYICKNSTMNGLYVRNGRLINERPNGLTGIQEAARNRKEMKRQEKISMYSDAFALGDMKAEVREMAMGIIS
jgi:hypothetical protein